MRARARGVRDSLAPLERDRPRRARTHPSSDPRHQLRSVARRISVAFRLFTALLLSSVMLPHSLPLGEWAYAKDKGGGDKGGSDKGGGDKGGSDKGGGDKGGSDKGASDKGGGDKGGSDKGASDKGASDKGASDKGAS